MSEIGFGQVPARTETWEKRVGRNIFVFRKTREKDNHFVYSCRCRSEDGRFVLTSSTGYETDRDVSRDEIEARPQFCEFIAGFSRCPV